MAPPLSPLRLDARAGLSAKEIAKKHGVVYNTAYKAVAREREASQLSGDEDTEGVEVTADEWNDEAEPTPGPAGR